MDKVLNVQRLSVLDLLDPAEINKRASIPPPSEDEFDNVFVVEGSVAATQPLITSMNVREMQKFKRAFLRKLRSDLQGKRRDWERFVAVRADADAMSMYPRLLARSHRAHRPALQLPAALSPRRIEPVRGTCERCLQDPLRRACRGERCLASAQSKLRGGNRSAGRRADRCRLILSGGSATSGWKHKRGRTLLCAHHGQECSPIRDSYRLYWFFFLSAWRSSPNWIRRSISSGYGTPDAAHSLGYMLIDVNPGMVLISFK